MLVGAWTLVSPLTAGPGLFIDSHSHYNAADAEALSPAEVLDILDASGVDRIVISGSPAELTTALHAHAPERVIPFLGVYTSNLTKAFWMHDAELPQRIESRLAAEDHWVGIGELHIFANEANNPVFAEVVRVARRHDRVLMIHGDALLIDRVFEIEPESRVLWAHLGTVPAPALVSRMLERHAERALWVDTSVRDERIAPEGVLDEDWRAVFERHPDRFLVAVDTFSTNRWRNYGEVVQRIRAWTEPLPEPLRSKLRYRNAEAVFGLADGE